MPGRNRHTYSVTRGRDAFLLRAVNAQGTGGGHGMASLIHVFRDRTPFRVICRQVSDIQQSADPMEMNLVANSLISGSFHASARYA